MKVLLQFRTPYCTNLRQYSKMPKRGGAHENAHIPSLQFSLPSSAPVKCDGLAGYVQENMLSSNRFTSIQSKTTSKLSEFRVSLQNFRVSFWHPKTAYKTLVFTITAHNASALAVAFFRWLDALSYAHFEILKLIEPSLYEIPLSWLLWKTENNLHLAAHVKLTHSATPVSSSYKFALPIHQNNVYFRSAVVEINLYYCIEL